VGDPPFTIDVDDIPALLNSTPATPSTPTSPLGFLSTSTSNLLSSNTLSDNPLLSTLSAVTGLTDYFEKVALESHTRMRKGDQYH